MKKMLFLPAFLLFFSVVLYYSYREGDMKAGVRLDDHSYMEDVGITQKKKGEVAWALQSKNAVFVTDNDVDLKDMTIRFPEKGLTLTSEGGRYDIGKRNLAINGNIRASTDTYVILAAALLWDGAKNELFSDKKVRIIGKRFVVEGDTLTATSDIAKLTNNVKAVFDGR